MKKSGNFLSFFLIGILSEILLLLLFVSFNQYQVQFNTMLLMSFMQMSVFTFLWRTLMDWKILPKNSLSRELREKFISKKVEDRFLFVLYLAIALTIFNPSLQSNFGAMRVFEGGILIGLLTIYLIEEVRVMVNRIIHPKVVGSVNKIEKEVIFNGH